jgi:hypothetical protein
VISEDQDEGQDGDEEAGEHQDEEEANEGEDKEVKERTPPQKPITPRHYPLRVIDLYYELLTTTSY